MVVTITPENTCSYPQHRHDVYEITYYLEGSGLLKTEEGKIPFSAGTIIVIPAGLKHGTSSDKPYRNISIHTGDAALHGLPLLWGRDDVEGYAKNLVQMIFRLSLDRKTEQNALLKSLFNAYRDFVLELLKRGEEDELALVKKEIVQNVGNASFSLGEALRNKGYAEDYVRARFKKRYGKTPLAYLTDLRLEYAKTLLLTYGKKLKIYEIASSCGFEDPLYFSKIFKRAFGYSPRAYVANQLSLG